MGLMEKLGKTFAITTELGPVKGALFQDSINRAREYLPLDGINIHDCPMGNLRINSVAMGSVIQKELNVDTFPHFTCRDRSLLGTQADLLGAHALGIRGLLVTTGDPPKHGPYPSKAVYDYNTFELLQLIKKMNNGLDYNDKEFGGNTDFKVACTAMPGAKDLDREVERIEKKINAGADFFQTQVVYDLDKAVKFADKSKKLGKPILMGIMPLKSIKMARYMKEHVEGIDVPDEVIAQMESGATGIEIACNIVKEIYT
jgi:homocysteine S-methyltransferase